MRRFIKTLFVFLIFFASAVYSSNEGKPEAGSRSKFPEISAADLNGVKVMIPGEASAGATLIVLAFSRQEIAATDAWVNTPAARYMSNSGFRYYEAAVIPDIPVISGIILNGIKGALPENKWQHFLICSADRDTLMKELSAGDASLFYVYVLDKHGVIKWSQKSKTPSNDDIKNILAAIEQQLGKK